MKKLINTVLLFFAIATVFAQPINDECANAINVALPFYSSNCQFTNVNATPSNAPAIPVPIPNWLPSPPNQVQKDVWFTFTTPLGLPVDLEILIVGCNPGFQPKYTLYKGNCGFLLTQGLPGGLFASNISSGDSLHAQVLIDPNTQYFLRIDNGIDSIPIPGDNFGFSLTPSYCNTPVPIDTYLSQCEGDSIVLMPSILNGTSYNWTPTTGLVDTQTDQTPSAIVDSSITYTCLVTDSLGCLTVTNVIIQVPDSIPQPTLVVSDSLLSVYPATSNSYWYYSSTPFSDVNSAQLIDSFVSSIVVGVSGYYQVVAFQPGSNCEVSSEVSFVDFTSTSPIEFIQNLQISPNPTTDFLDIRFENLKNQTIEITLLNNLGQLIYTEKFDIQRGMTNQRLDLSTIPRGNYFLQIRTQSDVITRRISKM
jgi:hypothetical protein